MADFVTGKPAGTITKSEKDYLFTTAYASSPALKDYFAKTALNPEESKKTIAMFDSQIEFWTQRGNREKRDIFLAAKSQLNEIAAEYAKVKKAEVTSPFTTTSSIKLGNDNIFTYA